MKKFKVVLFDAGKQVGKWTTDFVYYRNDSAEFKVKNKEFVIHGTFIVEELK